jgi:hypothetical protein
MSSSDKSYLEDYNKLIITKSVSKVQCKFVFNNVATSYLAICCSLAPLLMLRGLEWVSTLGGFICFLVIFLKVTLPLHKFQNIYSYHII